MGNAGRVLAQLCQATSSQPLSCASTILYALAPSALLLPLMRLRANVCTTVSRTVTDRLCKPIGCRTALKLQCKQTRLGRLQCGNSNCGMHLSRYAADEVCASFERRSRECPPWKPWKRPVACREAMPSRSRKCCNYLINHVVNGLYMLQRYYQQVPSTFWRSRPEDGTFLVLVKQRLDVGFGAAI